MVAIKRTLAAVATMVLALSALASQVGSRNDGSRWIQLRESIVLSGVTILLAFPRFGGRFD